MIQIGAYSEYWPDIHMTPEEGMRAHLDLQGGIPHGTMLPIHWGTFNLAPHPWDEPGEGTVTAAEATGAAIALPIPGQPFEPGDAGAPSEPWWRPFVASAPPVPATPSRPVAIARPAGRGARGTGGRRLVARVRRAPLRSSRRHGVVRRVRRLRTCAPGGFGLPYERSIGSGKQPGQVPQLAVRGGIVRSSVGIR